jgi:hypothetical protein
LSDLKCRSDVINIKFNPGSTRDGMEQNKTEAREP